MKQFVLPDETAGRSGRLVLKGSDYHYLVRVRRCREGDRIRGITRDGRLFDILFEAIGDSRCEVLLTPLDEHDSPKGPETEKSTGIVLIPGITKGKKMDLTIRQAVEAGAEAVYPVITDHSQVRYRNSDDAEAKNTLGQDRHRSATAVRRLLGHGDRRPPQPARHCIGMGKAGTALFLHEKKLAEGKGEQAATLFSRLAEPTGELGIIVGPEGGFSPAETAFLLEHGAEPVFLGKRVLRAETAAIYGLAAVATIIRERSEWHPA